MSTKRIYSCDVCRDQISDINKGTVDGLNQHLYGIKFTSENAKRVTSLCDYRQADSHVCFSCWNGLEHLMDAQREKMRPMTGAPKDESLPVTPASV
jgi:hypothetical protein